MDTAPALELDRAPGTREDGKAEPLGTHLSSAGMLGLGSYMHPLHNTPLDQRTLEPHVPSSC